MAKPFKKNGAWWVDYRDELGTRHRRRIGGSKRVAQEVATNIEDKVNRGLYLGVVEASRASFEDFARQWLKDRPADLAPRSLERFATRLAHLVNHFKGTALRSITPDQTREYINARIAAGRAVNTVNAELDVLMMVMRAAVKARLLPRNPLLDADGKPHDGVKHLKGAPVRVRYLDAAELSALLDACRATAYLEPFVLTCLNTGCRRDEVLSMTHATIDWTNRLVRLTQTKTGAARVVHLNGVAFDALQALPRRLDGKLWPFTSYAVSIAFRRATKRAGLVDFHLHDCRHHFASMHAMAGVNQAGLMRLLGHVSPAMTTRYAHIDDSYAQAAVDAVQIGAIKTA